jgi:hypothetical protein
MAVAEIAEDASSADRQIFQEVESVAISAETTSVTLEARSRR